MRSHFRKCKTLSEKVDVQQHKSDKKIENESPKIAESKVHTRKSKSIKIKNVIINYSFCGIEGDLKPKVTAKMRWRKVMNLIKAINRMKTFEIQEIHSLREIDLYLKHAKTSTHPQNQILKDIHKQYFTSREKYFEEKDSQESVNDFKYKEDTVAGIMNDMALHAEAMKLAELGDSRAAARLKAIIMGDCKRNLFSRSEKLRYFVNQPNSEGFTFLYQACINGNLNIVKMLFDCDAEHLIKCGVSLNEKLSILDAAVRWNHLKLTQYLLEENEFKLEWPKDYVLSALKIATNQNNKNMVKLLKGCKSMKKHTYCFFMCN